MTNPLPLRRLRRSFATLSATVALVALAAAPALAQGRGDSATVTASSQDCITIDVTSDPLAISNVVLQFADGDTQRFLDGSNTEASFAGTGEHAGETVTAVWVKAGNNKSGDGPGYGQFVEVSCDDEPEDPGDPEDPQDPGDPEDPQDPEDPEDPDDPEDPEGDDPEDDVPPNPRTVVDPIDEPEVDNEVPSTDVDEEVLNAVDERDPSQQAPQVLGVQETNDDTVVAAAAELPAAGLEDPWVTLLLAATSFALGAVLLRRTRGASA